MKISPDGIKHTVPLSDLRGGGPTKDGLPSIDNPKFIGVHEADDWLTETDLGISVSFNGVSRFYPNRITVWHEIVNDVVGGQPALVTYCPLCGMGIVFEPTVNGKTTEFGTAGRLWNSNLVMYDRQTDTYWSQVLGEAIVGELAGQKLKRLPNDNMLWRDWKKQFPDGEVLSRNAGIYPEERYLASPYGDYHTDKNVYFSVDAESNDYHPKAPTFGIELKGKFKAYPIEELDRANSRFTDGFAETQLDISYASTTRTIDIIDTETGAEITPIYGFWFSWFAVHPETEVFRAE